MKTIACALLLSLATSEAAFAASFKVMKAGEWKSEIVDSSLGAFGQAIKPQTLCVDENDVKRDWQTFLKDELKKSQMDCKLDKLKEETSSISFNIDCKGNEASASKNSSVPKDASFAGTVVMTRESDSSYLVDLDSKMSGLKLSEADQAKIPEAQRKALAGILSMQTGEIKMKVKQRYTFVKEGCVKKKSLDVKASVEPAIPAPAPEKK